MVKAVSVGTHNLVGLNGNLLCAVDCETTGFDRRKFEIIEICVMPLDSNIEPKTGIVPFHLFIKPEKTVDPEAVAVNRKTLLNAMEKGFSRDRAVDLFVDWFENLKLAPGKKVVPLGHNYVFDREHIIEFLGPETYDYCFDFRIRDTMISCQYLNDRAEHHNERIPFAKLNLAFCCSAYQIKNPDSHSALGDCIATAELYRNILQSGLI